MAGFYNPSTPETLGLEWLVDQDPTTFVLDSATKSYGVVMPGIATKLSQQLAVLAQAVSGSLVAGCVLHGAPYVEAVPQSIETDYAGTDTGADFTSPANGGAAAWLTQAGGVASYASVSPGVEDVTYLRNINQLEGPTPARLLMRGNNAVNAQMAGKRVLSVELHADVKTTLTTTPIVRGVLRLGSIDYQASSVAVPVGAGYTDLTLGLWALNPATGLPWTLPDVNNLITLGATDSFGLLCSYDARYTSAYADTVRVAKVYLKIRWQPEDRAGYAAGTVTATGWQTWTSKSVPNLLTKQDSNLDTLVTSGDVGTWVADVNTTITNDTTDRGAPWTRSLKMISGAAGTFGAKTGLYPAIAGKLYAFRCFAQVTAGRNTTVSIYFYDANGNLLQTSTSGATAGTGAFQALGMTAAVAAPTGTTQMKVGVQTTATAVSQTCFADGMFLGLDQAAITFVRDTSPGGAVAIKVDGAAEVTEIAHPTNELRVFRRVSGTGSMSLVTFGPGSSVVGMPLAMSSYRPTLQDDAGAILALNAVTADVTAFVTVKLHGWDTANGPSFHYSQPYAQRITGVVDTTNTIKSEMTLPAKTYVAVRLVVSGLVDVPGAALNLKIKRVSDDVQAGGTTIINATDLVQIIPVGGSIASRTTPQVFVVAIPTPGANTAAQYYVEASSTAPAGQGWVLYALDDLSYTADGVSVDTIVFGANVDAWNDPANGGRQTRRNGMIDLQTKPAAPSGLTATLAGTVVHLAWTATALGALYAATEVWRSNDRAGIDTDSYVQIADLDVEATATYDDPEGRRGVDATYKLRTRRTDGSLSDFTTATVAAKTPTTGFDLLAVSAETSASSYVGMMTRGDRVYKPPVERVLREFYGRDGAVAFIPLENPLDEFDVDVALYWAENLVDCSPLVDPPETGRAAFDHLGDLARASLSYVCVLDRDGNRWFANIAVTEIRQGTKNGQTPGGYLATLHVRELTRTPSTPTGNP